MTKWEYQQLRVYRNKVTHINDHLSDHRETLPEFLNQIGSQGWELVECYADNENPNAVMMILKKPTVK